MGNINVNMGDLDRTPEQTKVYCSPESKSTVCVDNQCWSGQKIDVDDSIIKVDDKPVCSSESPGIDKNGLPSTIVYNPVTISVIGNAESIATVHGHVTINGSMKGDIGTVTGNIGVSGNILGDIGTASGYVRANHIRGSVTTISGNIFSGS